MADQKKGKRVRVSGLPKFLNEAGSEASDTESPHFEDVVGSGASSGDHSRAGKAPFEEEEEENPDTHFK